MAITYEIKINGVRVTTQDELQDVVKEVDATLTGTEAGCNFSLPFSAPLASAAAGSFTAFDELTEAQLVSWVEVMDEKLDPIKAHIAYVLEKEVAKAALTFKGLPWAPAPADPAPATPPTE